MSRIGRYVPVSLIVLFAGLGVLFIGRGVLENLLGADGTVQPQATATPRPQRPRTPRPSFTPTPRPATPTPTAVREIGSRLELFVDDWLIDRMRGVSLRLPPPLAREVVLSFDRDWEGPVSNYVVVMKDDVYRMWYRAMSIEGGQRTAYAESTDGINWSRPTLGIVDVNGSKENNVVMDGSDAWDVSVFKDGNPETPDSERYKAIARGPKFQGRGVLRAFTSPDGLLWQGVETDPILVAPDDRWPMFDSPSIAFWDLVQEQYVVYMRGSVSPGLRAIRRSVSDDFRNWSEPEFIDLGQSRLEHLYTNAATPYFRAPHIYLMFPMRFTPDRKFHPDWPEDGLSEGVFMTSRDGIRWDRRFMNAFLRPGPDPENWSEGNMIVAAGVVPTGPREISVYYVEHYGRPTVRLRRATLRTDGFVSVHASVATGSFVTKPLIFAGDELVINYETSASGSIQVEVRNDVGQAIDGFRMSLNKKIFGDEIEHVVKWGDDSDLGALAGQPVSLRFVLQDADLYSIRFRESSP